MKGTVSIQLNDFLNLQATSKKLSAIEEQLIKTEQRNLLLEAQVEQLEMQNSKKENLNKQIKELQSEVVLWRDRAQELAATTELCKQRKRKSEEKLISLTDLKIRDAEAKYNVRKLYSSFYAAKNLFEESLVNFGDLDFDVGAGIFRQVESLLLENLPKEP